MPLIEGPGSNGPVPRGHILTKYTNARIAKTIIAAVDRLATLMRSEKLAEQTIPDPTTKTVDAGPKGPDRQLATLRPKYDGLST
jgi:hypothetical protein